MAPVYDSSHTVAYIVLCCHFSSCFIFLIKWTGLNHQDRTYYRLLPNDYWAYLAQSCEEILDRRTHANRPNSTADRHDIFTDHAANFGMVAVGQAYHPY